MDLLVARRELQRHLRFVQRFFEFVLRRERAGQAVMAAGEIGHEHERVLEFLVRLVEQAGRPQRVGVNRDHVGAARLLLLEGVGFFLRFDELAEAECRLDDADSGLHGKALRLGADGLAERLERLAIPRFLEQQRAELELEVRVVDVAPVHTGHQRRDDDRRYQRHARTE